MFRTVHTVKGTAGFLGLAKLEAVSHAGENLLSKLRSGELTLTAEIATALLGVVDAIRKVLASLEADGTEGDADFTAIIETLDRLMPAAGQPRSRVIAVPNHREAKVAPPTSAATAILAPPPPNGNGKHSTHHAPTTPNGKHALPAAPSRSRRFPRATGRAGTGADGSGRTPRTRRFRLEHPRRCRPARQADDPRRRAGARAQPDRAVQRLAGGRGVPRHRPAAEPAHHRAAGRRDEDADAADRQRVEQVPARRPRPRASPAASRSGSRWKGQETELDKTIIEAIRDPLTHIVRNAVDHGIETAGGSRRGGQAGRGSAAPARLPRGRQGHHRDHRRRRRHRPAAGARQGARGQADHRRAGRPHGRRASCST